ncbi:MAG: hypothetical protein K0R43_3899 [Pseudoduganella sp.]|jgi:hypothetical protein|nr:hypothetical protein [Pseudoduganella sp.]
MKTSIFSRFLRTVLMVCALAASGQAAADAMFMVSVDTSKLGTNVPGYLDFVFGGSAGAAPASATMTLVSGFDPLAFEAPLGDVLAVPGGFTFQNSINYNSAYYHATFGNTLRFMLTLAGDLGGLELSGFQINAFDEFGAVLGGAPGSDSLLSLAFVTLPNGDIDYLAQAVNADAVDVAAVAVPEPGALALAGLGLLMLGVVRRQRRN